MSSQALHELNAVMHKRKAGALTVLIFGSVLMLCFFLTAFTIQDPPPGEQFVAVGFADLGDVDEAGGETETEVPSEVVEEVVEESQAVESIEEPVVTEEVVTEEVSEMAIQTKEVVEEVVEEVVVEEPERTSIAADIIRNSMSSGGGGSEGESEGTGNEGTEDGKIEGTGVVTGNFGTASLNGGSLVSEPMLSEKPMKAGIVRVKIIVDGSGKVISTEYDGGKHSTLADSDHIRLAKIAAMTATFTTSTALRRSGYIDIRFELE